MSRISNDKYKDNKLYNGYDYINGAWVENGVYLACNHPKSMECKCYGKAHKGEPVQKGLRTGV